MAEGTTVVVPVVEGTGDDAGNGGLSEAAAVAAAIEANRAADHAAHAADDVAEVVDDAVENARLAAEESARAAAAAEVAAGQDQEVLQRVAGIESKVDRLCELVEKLLVEVDDEQPEDEHPEDAPAQVEEPAAIVELQEDPPASHVDAPHSRRERRWVNWKR
jgi:hypothetical protein